MTSTPSPGPEGEMKLRECPTPWCDHPEPPYLWQGPTDDYTFICPGCQVEGPYAATEEFARDAWNTRPTPIAEGDKELVEELRELRAYRRTCYNIEGDDVDVALGRAADRLEQLSGKY